DDPTNQNDVNLDGDAFREDERIRIPAVQGQTYYLQVFGVGAAINTYNMTILNEPAPVPFDIELDDNPADPTYDCNAANPSGLNSDTGRSHFDNITCDNTPTIVFRLDDGVLLNDLPGNNVADTPPDQVIPIPFRAGPAQPVLPGYAIAIFDEGATSPAPGNAPNANIRVPLGFATQIEPGLYQFTSPVLNDGSHFLTARVQMIDPANPQKTGFGERSQSLEIIVDTQDPQAFFGVTAVGDDGLHPDSDSGVDGPASPDTYTDRITNDTTPTFYGLAEADTVVRMYLDINQNNAVDAGDVFLGQTTAVPFDGNNQFGSPTFKPDGSVAMGQWEITSTVHMNDTEARSLGGALVALPFDGLRRMLITAEDVAGNVNAPQVLDIFVDTQGPQVTSVYITADPAFDLFDPKVPGGYLIPTPLINSISIDVQDLPNRIAAFVYDALEVVPATTTGHFQLRGDYNGIIPINTIAFLSDPQVVGIPRTGTIVLTFAEPLPDDRFTLTILDDVVDPAGNALDGENNAVEPQETPDFPTGDGQPGYDFVARFTVDSRPEIGVWASGSAWIDTNGNNKFDPGNADFVNRDIVYSFGNGSQATGDPSITTDDLFAGNFSFPGGPAADGFDKLAAYGAIGFGLNNYRWLIDTDNDGVPDINNAEPLNINGLPVAGNFDGNRTNGDEVAVYTGTEWFFDTDHNYQLNANSRLVSNLQGYPIIGDFDGDGMDDLATWTDDRFMFDLSSVGASAGILPGLINGQADRTINFGFIGVRELPVAADMDKDGIDDVGLWVPERNGQTPEEISEWYFLISGAGDLRNGYLPGAVVPGITAFNRLSHAFEPVPFGRDLYAQYGDTYGIAIVGNFDPPVAGTGSAGANPVDFTNDRDPNDVNGDGHVTPIDVLVVVNALNERRTSTDATIRSGKLFGVTTAPNYLDPNGDTYVSPADALKVINFMNARGPLGGEGEGAVWTGEVDAAAVLPAATAAGELSVQALVVDRADADLATAAGWLATLDRRPGAVDSAAPQDLVALLAQDTAARQTTAGAWQAQEVHAELVSELGASELTADLLDELSVVTNEEDTDQAIEELFG
ncbi:MAG: dockerin type I domain-containing protein, partial [Pirellulaceae bacterium]